MPVTLEKRPCISTVQRVISMEKIVKEGKHHPELSGKGLVEALRYLPKFILLHYLLH